MAPRSCRRCLADAIKGLEHENPGEAQSVCEGAGVFSAGRIATLNKYGAARVGANLLEAARPALLDTAERADRARAPSRGFVL